MGEQRKGHGEKLSRKKEQAITALLTQPTVTRAARKAGVTDATLRSWMKEPAFSREYREARRQVVEAAIGLLQRATCKAVRCLVEKMGSYNHNVCVRAAAVILDLAFKGVELADLVEQVEALKSMIAQQKEDNR